MNELCVLTIMAYSLAAKLNNYKVGTGWDLSENNLMTKAEFETKALCM